MLLGLLVFGANVDSLLASVAGNTSGVTSGNTTGNTIGSTTGSSSNTTSSNTSGNTSAKTFLETNFEPFQPFYAPRQQASLASDTFVVLSLDNGKNQTSMVLDSLEGQRVELTELDRVHSLQIHVVNPLGLTESAQGFYIVTLSQPTSWPAGQSQLSLTYLGQTLQLLRTDTSATWEVGVIDSNGILAETGKKILVVQKSGTYQPLDFQVSYGAGVKPLNGTASSSSATSLTLQKSNFVELNAASSSSSSVSSVGATGSSSGGGGGGCLLR